MLCTHDKKLNINEGNENVDKFYKFNYPKTREIERTSFCLMKQKARWLI